MKPHERIAPDQHTDMLASYLARRNPTRVRVRPSRSKRRAQSAILLASIVNAAGNHYGRKR